MFAERAERLFLRLSTKLPDTRRVTFENQPHIAMLRSQLSKIHEETALSPMQVDLFGQITRALRDRASLSDLLRQTVDGLILWLSVERGLLLTRATTAEGEVKLVPRVARGLSRDDLRGEQLQLSMTLAKRAMDTLEPVVAVDAADGADISSSIAILKLRSVLAVPLIARGKTLGVVYLDDRVRRGAFGPKEIAWVRLLATQAALAISDRMDQIRERRLTRSALAAKRRLEESLHATESALEQALASQPAVDVRGFRHDYREIVGQSAPLRKVLSMLDRLADSSDPNLSVLIAGESGTGKELIARAIHRTGPRRSGPFVAENVSAMPEPLLESALFGHVRGAFTGADKSRSGLFVAANGGTLFLDEIGEMSLSMQAKLLRALQEREVRALGSDRTTRIDVSIISATHRNLEELVSHGKFRQDLLYRLAVISVDLPPLRERREDIPPLVHHLLSIHAPKGRRVRITKSALTQLMSAPWPGNVRQLDNELRRAVLLAGDTIDVEHLSVTQGAFDGAGSFRDQMDMFEKKLVARAISDTGGNVSAAAKVLGVSRFGLQKMLKRLGISALE
jgi:transcriptional regulator with GAF, ATPase, and Fis domain